MDPKNAKYIMDYLYFTRDDEPFRYYKNVSFFFIYYKNFVITNYVNQIEWIK